MCDVTNQSSDLMAIRSLEYRSLPGYKYLSYLSIKPYSVGTQKECVAEMIVLCAHHIGFEGQILNLEPSYIYQNKVSVHLTG